MYLYIKYDLYIMNLMFKFMKNSLYRFTSSEKLEEFLCPAKNMINVKTLHYVMKNGEEFRRK